MNIIECLEKVAQEEDIFSFFDVENVTELDLRFNDEQILDYCLEHFTKCNFGEENPISSLVITLYILKQFDKQNKIEFDEDEIEQEFRKLIADYVLASLCRKELVDVALDDNGQFVYCLSEKGKDKLKNDYKDI